MTERAHYVFPSGSNPNLVPSTVKSFDSMTWSATNELNRRPSLTRYSNRYERHAKDGFAYWPSEITSQKPRCKFID
jgi:hypothetical protein